MNIALINIPLNSEIGRVAKSLGLICLHHLDGDIIYSPFINSLSEVLENTNIDTIIWWGPEYNPIPSELYNLNIYKIAVIGDWNLSFSYIKEIINVFDFVVCDKLGVEILKQHGFSNVYNWRGNGFNPETFKNLNLDRIYDITFAGTINNDIHRKREKFIYRIAKLSSKIKVNIVTAVYGDDYVKLLNQSKLVFNFGIRKEANMRFFESLACGSLPLVEEENLEIFDIFNSNQLALYNENNLENVILDLTYNDNKRLKLLESSFNKSNKETYKNHLLWLLNLISLKKNNEHNILEVIKNEKHLDILFVLNNMYLGISKDYLKDFIDNFDHKNCDNVFILNIYALIISNFALIYSDSKTNLYYKKALKVLNKAIILQEHPILFYNYSNIALQLGMIDSSIEKLKYILYLLEEYNFDFSKINCVKFPLDLNLFRVEFENSLAENKETKNVLLWKVCEKLGELFLEKNDLLNSKKYFSQSLEFKYELSSYSLLCLGKIYYIEGKLIESYNVLKKAQLLDPLNIEIQEAYLNILSECNFKDLFNSYHKELLELRKICPSYILKRERALNVLILYDQFGSEIKR